MSLVLGVYLSRIKTTRAAVVPYIVFEHNDHRELYFLLARDRDSGDITDLGGGVKKNESALSAALREFKEETNEIFGSLYDNVNKLNLTVAILDDQMSTIFAPVPQEWYNLTATLFKKGRNDHKNSHREISELMWISSMEFKNLIFSKNSKLWTRIKKFYQKGYTYNLEETLKYAYR